MDQACKHDWSVPLCFDVIHFVSTFADEGVIWTLCCGVHLQAFKEEVEECHVIKCSCKQLCLGLLQVQKTQFINFVKVFANCAFCCLLRCEMAN